MSVLLVDWLGRGGIAQTTAAWSRELGRSGIQHTVVTRPGRELTGSHVVPLPTTGSRLRQHVRVVRSAVRQISHHRPDVVVVQNHVLPPVEIAVDRAARRCGAAVVRVVHDHVLHSRAAGTQLALDRALRSADVVVAHSSFVASNVERRTGRRVSVMPLPSMWSGDADPVHLPAELRGRDPVALQFGVVHRAYKGADTTAGLAAAGVPPWHFALLGVGAARAPGLLAIDRYLGSDELAAAIASSAVSLFPYRHATQSGGVSLAQSLGSVVLAAAVGGIPEQVAHGVDGLLIEAGSDLDDWIRALAELADPERRAELAVNARQRALDDCRAFAATVVGIATGEVPA